MSRPGAAHEFERIDDPRGRVVRPHGELDAEAGARLQEAMNGALDEVGVPVVLDLSQVSFMDSTALSIVLQALRGAWGRGQALLVSGPLQPSVASLFSITGVTRFVTVHDSRETALDALAS